MDEKPINSEPPPDSPDPAFDGTPDEVTEDLVAFLDGELDAGGNEKIEAKISLDSTVRAEADSLKKTWDLLDYLPRSEPSPSFTERTISRIEPLKGSGSLSSQSGPTVSRSGAAAGPARMSSINMSASKVPLVPPSSTRRSLVAAGWVLAIGIVGLAGWFIRDQIVGRLHENDQRQVDSDILTDRRLLEKMRDYRHVDDLKFLQALDDPDLFGEEQPVIPMSEGGQ